MENSAPHRGLARYLERGARTGWSRHVLPACFSEEWGKGMEQPNLVGVDSNLFDTIRRTRARESLPRFPVFATRARIEPVCSGEAVRRSITATLTPSFLSCSVAGQGSGLA